MAITNMGMPAGSDEVAQRIAAITAGTPRRQANTATAAAPTGTGPAQSPATAPAPTNTGIVPPRQRPARTPGPMPGPAAAPTPTAPAAPTGLGAAMGFNADQFSQMIRAQTDAFRAQTQAAQAQSANGVPASDDVAQRVNAITASGSPLMTQAATTGLEMAARRGLANSSMAVGSAQNAVIAAATPIASQDSAQSNSRYLSAQQIAAENARQAQQIAAQKAMQTEQLGAQKDMQGNDLSSREKLAGMDDSRIRELAMQDINFRTSLAGQEDKRLRDLQAQQISADATKTDKSIAAQQQDRMAQSLTELSSQRFNANANTLANDKIPGAARSAVQSSINQQYDSTVNYLSNLYGVKVSNATPGTAA